MRKEPSSYGHYKMRYFQDLLLLLIYGSSAVFFTEISPLLVVAFLLALILCCSCYFLESRRLRLILCCFYLAIAVLNPDLFYFVPATVYLLLRDAYWLPVLLSIFLSLYQLLDSYKTPVQIFFSCLAFVIAYFLQKRTQEYQTLVQNFYNTRDDSQEQNLLLSEKNQSLLEKQDSEIYMATLKERNRIAREIHDNVGHILSRSILMVGALNTINTQEALSPMLKNLDSSLNSAMDSIRTSVHDLHDESVNLEEVVRGMLNEFTFCPTELTYDMGHNIPKEVKYCFISITKEAFSNIIKHSNATKVLILIREHPALFQLCIEDNGTTHNQQDDSGIGLSNMLERTRSLNGTFQVIHKNGFKIFVTIPKKQWISR